MTEFMLDKPHQIQAFALLQVYHKLKLEVANPGGPKWRVSPAMQTRTILENAGRPVPNRNKKKTLETYEAYLREVGVLN